MQTELLILEAAETEFLEKGFAGARMVSIAERAGVNHALLHYYFRSKEQLFDKVVTAKLTKLLDSCLSVFEDTSVPIGERLQMGISAHIDFIAANPLLPRFLVNESGRLKLETVTPFFQRLTATLESLRNDIPDDIEPFNFFVSVISLDIFPFLLAPLMNKMFPVHSIGPQLESLKNDNVKMIKKCLGI